MGSNANVSQLKAVIEEWLSSNDFSDCRFVEISEWLDADPNALGSNAKVILAFDGNAWDVFNGYAVGHLGDDLQDLIAPLGYFYELLDFNTAGFFRIDEIGGA